MNRRGFLSFLGAAVASATLDPEKLLWEPGKKLISIPKPPGGVSIRFLRGLDVRQYSIVTRMDVLYGIGHEHFQELVCINPGHGIDSLVVKGDDFDHVFGEVNARVCAKGMEPIDVPYEQLELMRKPSKILHSVTQHHNPKIWSILDRNHKVSIQS